MVGENTGTTDSRRSHGGGGLGRPDDHAGMGALSPASVPPGPRRVFLGTPFRLSQTHRAPSQRLPRDLDASAPRA